MIIPPEMCFSIAACIISAFKHIAVFRMRGRVGFAQLLEQLLIVLPVPNLECDVLSQSSQGGAAKHQREEQCYKLLQMARGAGATEE